MARKTHRDRIAERFGIAPSDVTYVRGLGWVCHGYFLQRSFYELQHTLAWALRELPSSIRFMCGAIKHVANLKGLLDA